MPKSVVDLMLVAVVLIWGGNYTVAKFGMQSFSPEVFTLYRFLLAIPVLAAIVWWRERDLLIRLKDVPAFILAAWVGITLYQTLFVASVKYTSASNASLLVALSPLFTVLGAVIVKQVRVTPTLITGSCLAVLGVVLIKGTGDAKLSFTLASLKGDLLAAISSLLFGLYPFTTARLVKHYSAMKLTLYTAMFGSFFLAIYCGKQIFEVDWGALPLAAWGSLLYSAYPVTAYSLAVWNYGMERLGSARVMPYMYAVPIAAIIVAMIWIDEKMNGWQWGGALLILAGVGIVRQGGQLLEYWRNDRQTARRSVE